MADEEQPHAADPAQAEVVVDSHHKIDRSESHGDAQDTREEVSDGMRQNGDVEEAKEVEDAQEEAAEGSNHEMGPPTPAKDDQPSYEPATPSEQTNGQPSTETPVEQQSVATSDQDTPIRSLPDSTRQRTDSQSTTATNATRTSTVGATRSSMVFVVTALESIAASKDARKRKPLQDSVQQALSAIRSAHGDASQINPEIMFEPLNLATEAATVSIVVTALDCIGKLISYSYFSAPAPTDQRDGQQKPPLIDRAIDTICDCFQGEATPAEVQMQIIKSLLAAILNDKIVVHGAGLLKSVRQTYNIFLLSKNSANQQIAQGTLTQMVNTVFDRVKVRVSAKSARANSSRASLTNESGETPTNGEDTPAGGDETPLTAEPEPETPVEKDGQPMTLQTFETRKSFDDANIADSAPTTVSRTKRAGHNKAVSRTASGQEVPSITVQGEGNEVLSEDDEEDEIYIKDAFLVFRAMCKLSTKSLRVEDAVEIKSQGMRSKLLSLHIIHTVLFNHSTVFTSPHATIRSSSNGEPTPFTQAIKQYLCLSLSRNGASSVNRVFEVSAEIFWLMMKYLRPQLKRELEVFLKEIYLTILDKRAAPGWQKSYIIQNIFGRIGQDPRALVEIYLNYDCDRAALDNMYQRIIEHVSRAAGQPVQVNGLQQQAWVDHASKTGGTSNDWRERGTLPPSLATANMTTPNEGEQIFPPEYALKMQSLECLVDTLRSLVNWSQQGLNDGTGSTSMDGESRVSVDEARESMDTRGDGGVLASPSIRSPETGTTGTETPLAEDDPDELEKVKQRKTALNNAIRQFNYKPKRGIKTLTSESFIPSSDPTEIARFLISHEQIDKKALGEFLGEGDEANIKIMHAFVDCMDFTKTRFVDALRRWLQSFRLPGEAQKIDRLVLKFAERYTTGNPNAFANADTAYVLSYSVIMLNTDQHSANVKKRMTPEDFIKNNRGINDNADLPDEYLQGIFEEIQHNEIVLDTERETEANLRGPQPAQSTGIVSALANVGRDLQREAYAQASDAMSNRTEQLFKSLLRSQRRGGAATTASGKNRFLTASSSRHVGPMFEVAWMSFLTALSGGAQETQNLETIRLCMEGQKLAIRISCLFDLSDPRQAFVASLAQSTSLYNLSEMKAKNVEALRALLEIAFTEGNHLKESWRDVLTCISQLDRFQLISSGVEEGAVPDMLRTQSQPQGNGAGRKSMQVPRRQTGRNSANFQPDIAEESRSADMIRVVDRIFTNTANLSGDAIVHFVKALTQVSWQEIQSSGQSESPRTYSLQKLVEISGYNMLRVRFEWTTI